MDLFLSNLNDKQKEAVVSDNQYILILAGAGSGKTRTLTQRIAYLISKQKIKPASILAVTFTNKAARELKERLHELIKSELNTLWVGTFHSTCARILRTEGEANGLSRNFTIYDTDDQVSAIKKVMSNLNIPQQLHSPKLFQNRISKAKNNFIFPEDLEKETDDSFENYLPDVYAEYQEFLKKNNALDFDDLLIKPIELFTKHPKILEKYQKKFQHILIDEYQDTNKTQYLLVKKLTGKKGNLCVVGDEDQSIYKWRGADINNILNFNKDYPDAEVYRLEENYRSFSNILNGANALVKNNKERIGKNLWTDLDEGEKIVINETETDIDEAKKVVENIHNEMYSKKRTFNDIAILYRTNAQSRLIEQELRKNHISYEIVGGVRFYERKEIKDILAYLKIICNPNDSVSLKRIVNFPLRGIGETTVGKIEKFAETLDISLLEGMAHVQEINTISAGMAARVIEFYDLIKKYRELKNKISAAELTSTLTSETGIIEHLKNEYDQSESENRLANVYELFNSIAAFTEEREKEGKDGSLDAFLEEAALMADIDSMQDQNNTVTLMTLHSSKGLEFPVIFITGLEMGLFPLQRNSADESELEEERRLLYVGMTRARENLYISYARKRRKYNTYINSVPSLFIDEIPLQYVNFKSKIAQETASPKTRTQERRKKMLEYFKQEDESQEVDTLYQVGNPVYHETFGKGVIQETEGKGPKMKVSVMFEGNISKKLIAKYANLSKLEEN